MGKNKYVKPSMESIEAEGNGNLCDTSSNSLNPEGKPNVVVEQGTVENNWDDWGDNN